MNRRYHIELILIILLSICFKKCFFIEMNTFEDCIKSNPLQNTKYCVGQQAISFLERFDESLDLCLVEGVRLERNDSVMPRVINSDFSSLDPSDFPLLLEKFGVILGQRTLHVDLHKVEPGLYMKVSPLVANGVLEFIMDQNSKRDYTSSYKSQSIGRVAVRNFLVPFLLGIKFNIATLFPLIFGLMILISKKAIFLLKIVVFISNLFSFGGLGGLGGHGGYPYASSPAFATGNYPYKQYGVNAAEESSYYDVKKDSYKFSDYVSPLNHHNDDNFYHYEKESYQPAQTNFDRDRLQFRRSKNVVWRSTNS